MKRSLFLPLLGICLASIGCGRTKVVETVVGGAGEPAVHADAPAGEPYQFPKDASGVLLAKTLAPTEPQRVLGEPSAAVKPFPVPSGLTLPGPTLGPGEAILPVVPPQPIARELMPSLVADEATFSPREELSLPQAVFFPVPNPARLASRDVNKPIPLPVLAKKSPDRAPTEDATGEASAAAALSSPAPQRARPVPFAKLKIAETYEDRAAVRLTVPPPEATIPAARATPQTPGK